MSGIDQMGDVAEHVLYNETRVIFLSGDYEIVAGCRRQDIVSIDTMSDGGLRVRFRRQDGLDA